LRRAELPAGHFRAELALLVVALLWGSTFAAIKVTLEEIHYSLLLAYRFSIATLALLPLCLGKRAAPSRAEWRAGGLLALFLFGGYLTQTIGLQYTSAPKSAFITSMVVVFVPLVSIVLEKRIPRRSSLLGVGLAACGLYILIRPEGERLNPGDIWTLACVISWAIYIVQLQIETRRHDRFSLLLVQMILMSLLCWAAVGVNCRGGELAEGGVLPSLRIFGVLVYLGIACTALTTGLQVFFQRGTTSTRAVLIYTVEPVAATVIAWLWIGDRMTLPQALGALIVLGGILLAELFPERRQAGRLPGRARGSSP